MRLHGICDCSLERLLVVYLSVDGGSGIKCYILRPPPPKKKPEKSWEHRKIMGNFILIWVWQSWRMSFNNCAKVVCKFGEGGSGSDWILLVWHVVVQGTISPKSDVNILRGANRVRKKTNTIIFSPTVQNRQWLRFIKCLENLCMSTRTWAVLPRKVNIWNVTAQNLTQLNVLMICVWLNHQLCEMEWGLDNVTRKKYSI